MAITTFLNFLDKNSTVSGYNFFSHRKLKKKWPRYSLIQDNYESKRFVQAVHADWQNGEPERTSVVTFSFAHVIVMSSFYRFLMYATAIYCPKVNHLSSIWALSELHCKLLILEKEERKKIPYNNHLKFVLPL